MLSKLEQAIADRSMAQCLKTSTQRFASAALRVSKTPTRARLAGITRAFAGARR